MPSARTEVIIRQDVFERVEATVSMRRPSAQPESSADSSDRPGPSGTAQQLDEQLREILGDLEIPDGVDPAFLAALPEDMRREVIRDHLRQQGRVSVARSQPAESVVGVPAVVNENADGEGDDANANLPPPLDQEFLTALPPELQQELIEQHERDVRLAREAQNPPSNPPVEEPVDPGALLESLPPSLRAQVLANADDSVIQVPPQNFPDEARRLRANLQQQQAMRYARMMNPRSTFPRNPLNYARLDFPSPRRCEEGQDAGDLLRDPNYALFTAAPGDRATYMINKTSYINPKHLDYFKFVGKIIAKAIYENKLLDCYFTRAFYKHILSLPVRYQDIDSENPSYYKSLEFLLTNPVEHVADLTFSVDIDEFGVVSRRQLWISTESMVLESSPLIGTRGFANLEGMNGVQKFSIHCDFRSNDRLPAAHTCFNQLDLPLLNWRVKQERDF
ncbi:hypothetical protein QR680_002591 [Steinernema hermaphroditum]|uniref:HECT-type E3 ubiquitin transferase n=1 Tax=Steinernema hermaphroditum TaxID=289476 RepID=A0AA39H5E4_9BILA|nr:hypothetical protein QR680_002591 [Steinernema hermaphroditum]